MRIGSRSLNHYLLSKTIVGLVSVVVMIGYFQIVLNEAISCLKIPVIVGSK